MQSHCKKFLLAGFFIASLLCGCGKKRKNIFSFPSTQKKIISVHTLDFPCVKNVQAVEIEGQLTISWAPIQIDPGAPLYVQESSQFMGYNIYGFGKNNFIPHKPVNKKYVHELSFTFKKKKNSTVSCFVVVAVFQHENEIFEGPTSKICCV